MSEGATTHHTEALRAYNEIRKMEKELKSLNAELQINNADKDQLDSNKQDVIRSKTKLEIDVLESTDKKSKEQDRVVCTTA